MRKCLMVETLVGVSGTACLALAIIFSGCGFPLLINKAIAPMVPEGTKTYAQRRPPAPESEWNRDKLWYRSESDPPIYLPKGFSRDRVRNEKSGTWIEDERDGKRFFVPKGGSPGVPEAVLMVEARKATMTQPVRKQEISPSTVIFGEVAP